MQPVEVGTMGTVEFAPASAAVGTEPEIGLVEVAEQQELANLPRRRQPHHVGDRLVPDLAGRRPALVLPPQGEGLVTVVVPPLPAGRVPVGGEGAERGRHPARLRFAQVRLPIR